MTLARANALVALAAVGGVLLFASDYPVHAWPLQLVAVAPLLFALAPRGVPPSAKLAALLGLAFGAGYTMPLIAVLRFPLLLGGALALYVTALWIVFALGARIAMTWRAPWGGLGVAAVAVVIEWFDFTVIPIWGTAQSFVRVWSAVPVAIQFVSITGVLGLVFVVVAPQALLVQVLAKRNRTWKQAVVVAAAILAVAAAFDAIAWTRAPIDHVTVAALGWTGRPGGEERVAVVDALVAEAAAKGAKLVVTPEVSFLLAGPAKPKVLAELAAVARARKVTLLVGYFDRDRNDNRIASFGPDGAAHDEYQKTHLIQSIEGYKPGPGNLVVVPLGAGATNPRVGGMICQDDNFTDLARGYGKRQVAIVGVPTNDWLQVAQYHLENALFRGIEDRYAIVRAASNGISVIASARGEVLARHDPFVAGRGMALATVPIFEGGSIYATLGDLPFVVLALALLAVARWRGRGSGDTTRGPPATPAAPPTP